MKTNTPSQPRCNRAVTRARSLPAAVNPCPSNMPQTSVCSLNALRKDLLDVGREAVEVTAKRKNLSQMALASREEAAAPVIKKTHKPGAVEPDPIRGLIEAAVDGQSFYKPQPLRPLEEIRTDILHDRASGLGSCGHASWVRRARRFLEG